MSDSRALVLDGVFYRVSTTDILNGVYLKVPRGTICGLFGRNGSGKTTLLKVASGQVQANSGITINDGERLHKRSRRRRFSSIAYLPQESMLPPDVTVTSLLRGGGLDPGDVHERVQSVRTQDVRSLSGGERRLLEIEIVLGLDRDYVLLDEPFTGVEPLLIDEMSQRIEQAAAQGVGVLVTDHYHQYVTPLVDQAYVLWQKQCYRLDAEAPIEEQLDDLGYIRSSSTADHSTGPTTDP
jgi:lipopolysaccharide export system ATP-binding protein